MSTLSLSHSLADCFRLRNSSALPAAGALGRWSARWSVLLSKAVNESKLASQVETDVNEIEQATEQDVRACLESDGEAFQRVVERYQSLVGATMWRFTRDRLQWEQLVQDVFVEAYYSLKNYRGPDRFPGWLKTIATRVGYSFWKSQDRLRKRGEVQLDDFTQFCSGEEGRTHSPEEAGRLVHAMLAQLPPRDRLVLTLHYFESCSVAQISERTGWSRSLVKVQAHRARKKLKRLFDEMDT